jgi:hypothetical protein
MCNPRWPIQRTFGSVMSIILTIWIIYDIVTIYIASMDNTLGNVKQSIITFNILLLLLSVLSLYVAIKIVRINLNSNDSPTCDNMLFFQRFLFIGWSTIGIIAIIFFFSYFFGPCRSDRCYVVHFAEWNAIIMALFIMLLLPIWGLAVIVTKIISLMQSCISMIKEYLDKCHTCSNRSYCCNSSCCNKRIHTDLDSGLLDRNDV